MSSSLDMSKFDARIAHAIAQLSNQSRRQMQADIGKYLRKANQQRMAAQKSPDGATWAKRKGSGSASGPMFKKLRSSNHLKLRQQSDGLKLGWSGQVGAIARIHHYGLSQRLAYGTAKYAARELIGISDADAEAIITIITEHLDL